MTQNEKVLRHLQEHGSITPLDALKEYSIMRLASRIRDLKRMGIKITSKIETSKNSYGETQPRGKELIMANFSFNKVILGGRLTSDPELKTTQSGISVCSFSIAVNRRTKPGIEQQTDFFNVTAWRQTADFVARYFNKGSSICIVGALQNSSWQDQNGQKHYRTDIVADEVMFVDSRSDGGQATPTADTPTPKFPTPKFDEIDDDIPF